MKSTDDQNWALAGKVVVTMICTCGHHKAEHLRVGDNIECFQAVSENVSCACRNFNYEKSPDDAWTTWGGDGVGP